MKRRNFLGLLAANILAGEAAGEAIAYQIAERIESDKPNAALRFINKKTGTTHYASAMLLARVSISFSSRSMWSALTTIILRARCTAR